MRTLTAGRHGGHGPCSVGDHCRSSAGWTESSLRVVELPPGGRATSCHRRRRGDGAAAGRRLRGRVRRRTVRTARPGLGLRRPADIVYLPGHRTPSGTCERRRAGSPCGATAPAAGLPFRTACRGRGRVVELRGAGNCSRQVHNFGTAGRIRRRLADRLRGDHPGGNWSSLSRRTSTTRTAEHESSSRRSTTSRSPAARAVARLRLSPGVRHAGPSDRGARRGAHRRRGAGAARLSRPVGRRARLRHVLPERDGRAGAERAWRIVDDPRTPGSGTTWPGQPDRPAACCPR